ncbi:hypothetical protein BDW59DRAFT_154464 [Aspergillus cavernicola]|uniref:Uncharacterized protein n=1 Tax=Aspergillus cavernicola TaxID=176166 RepID=A0ABR4HFG8_9EURO
MLKTRIVVLQHGEASRNLRWHGWLLESFGIPGRCYSSFDTPWANLIRPNAHWHHAWLEMSKSARG